MPDFDGAEVYTAEGKKLGKVKEMNSNYFTVYKEGLATDEEFSVPVSAISAIDNENKTVQINMKVDQLKHGFEFTRAKPNSELVSGVSESQTMLPRQKPLIHYESMQAVGENRPLTRPSLTQEYLCDMCNARFSEASGLETHRLKEHKAPTGL